MVASGLGLVLSRFVWTTNAWLVPYALFWIWVIAVSIRLLRKASMRIVAPPTLSRSPAE